MTNAREFDEDHRYARDANHDPYWPDWGSPVRPHEYTSFYHQHHQHVLLRTYAKARRVALYVGAGVDVEGAVQEAFVAFWRHLDLCDARGVPSTIHIPGAWVAKVAWFHVLRQVDRSAVQQQKLVETLSETMQVHHTPLGDPVVTAVLAAEAVEQILALPGNQKLVAYLRFVEQWSNDEIADLLGISSHTVRVHAHRARNELRGVPTHLVQAKSTFGDIRVRRIRVRWKRLGAACVTAALMTLVPYTAAWTVALVVGAVMLVGIVGWDLTRHIVPRRRSRRRGITRARNRKDHL